MADYGVQHVIGYSCAPANPDTWWCPEVGYSLTEGHSLFTTETDALLKAITATDQKAAQYKLIARQLRTRLRER